MRQCFLYLLILIYFTGCTLSEAQGIGQQHRIPLDPHRWYQLNNAAIDLARLSDGKPQDKIVPANKPLLDKYEIVYPLLPGEQMTIDSIALFDWEGTNEDKPTLIYAEHTDGKRVLVATFTGAAYNEWVGPEPKDAHRLSINTPVSDIRSIIISTQGALPGEIVFFGPYVAAPVAKVQAPAYAPLRNFMGVNAFEWDFEEPSKPMELDPARLGAIRNFTSIRHYMDWEKLEGVQGAYAFAPTYNGSWNYDAMYRWCRDNNIEVLPCFKTIPGWMQASYPAGNVDNENVPMKWGSDPLSPMSYAEQAKVAFQFAARYGTNSAVDRSTIKLKGDNKLLTGQGHVKYIECDNERDKWWKGRKAYQTAWEYAANLSAFYDGHKNSMGHGVGVKNADPSMKVVIGGLAFPNAGYLQGMIDWSRAHRGYRPDGSVDVPWDVINYHFYAGDAGGNQYAEQSSGMCPELAKADSLAKAILSIAHMQLHDMPVWITETGYDLDPGSPQAVAEVKGKTAEQVQADWLLRTSLLYARTGIERLFFYQLYDDKPGSSTRYATSGLVNKDRTPRLAASYLRQAASLLGDYTYNTTLSRDPIVDKYTNGSKEMYVLVVPDQAGRTAQYTVNIGVDSASICMPSSGQTMSVTKRRTNNGRLQVTVTETPVFVTGMGQKTSLTKR